MIARRLAAAVRRRHTDSRGSCALWVNVRYIEPWGYPEWAVVVHTFEYEREVGRHRSMLRALLMALRAPNIGSSASTEVSDAG